ncbi:37S ribosomal protein S22, mitochondrial [Rhizoctonia solani]|uniref:37S ribosomal protein S22, mitochondrial n=1 Tax=Rhizoctonia solani TaxID=456999 RepID=A0A8H8NVG9_9AGAM|nr:37S ribosomal protein S22, mitochondrial [Rhizoctonia solani]QRW20821.1 37S ribosomal protein S22, mitochondrial [Rhizoctonia solani]
MYRRTSIVNFCGDDCNCAPDTCKAGKQLTFGQSGIDQSDQELRASSSQNPRKHYFSNVGPPNDTYEPITETDSRETFPALVPSFRFTQHPPVDFLHDDESSQSIRAESFSLNGALLSPTPVTSLMLVEVERRLDVFIFRCCFATSAWQARQLVVHGKLN